MSIPEGVTSIGNHAFDGCRSIRLYNITFTPKEIREKDFSNAKTMLETKDFSMKLNANIKYAAVSFWMKTEDEAAEAFIKKSISRIMAFLIENNNTKAIGKILESGKFITKKNIDKFITSAIEHTQNGGSPEIQTMLMHYKSEVTGYKDPKAQFKLKKTAGCIDSEYPVWYNEINDFRNERRIRRKKLWRLKLKMVY